MSSSEASKPRFFYSHYFDECMMYFKKTLIILLQIVFLLHLQSCSSINPLIKANEIASRAQMAQQKIAAGIFTLNSYSRISDPAKPIHIYIEGDGMAWVTRTQISTDPTPIHPLVLQLASVDTADNVVYIARPCQFHDFTKTSCDQAYWTNKRFSEEVINSINIAIDFYTKQSHQPQVKLFGYSGGGAIASLLAARRSDVIALTTVAGNLDPASLNRYHGVSAMPESLNPLDGIEKLEKLPQLHFVGRKDAIVPLTITQAFINKIPSKNCAKLFIVENASHEKGWLEIWPKLLKQKVECSTVDISLID
jgi:hypothetical protein